MYYIYIKYFIFYYIFLFYFFYIFIYFPIFYFLYFYCDDITEYLHKKILLCINYNYDVVSSIFKYIFYIFKNNSLELKNLACLRPKRPSMMINVKIYIVVCALINNYFITYINLYYIDKYTNNFTSTIIPDV